MKVKANGGLWLTMKGGLQKKDFLLKEGQSGKCSLQFDLLLRWRLNTAGLKKASLEEETRKRKSFLSFWLTCRGNKFIRLAEITWIELYQRKGFVLPQLCARVFVLVYLYTVVTCVVFYFFICGFSYSLYVWRHRVTLLICFIM